MGCVLLLTRAVLVVVIVPSLECILQMARVVSFLAITPSLMVDCMLVLTGTVLDVVIAPSVWGAEVTPTDWERVVFNSVHRKHTSQHFTSIAIKDMKEIPYSRTFSLGTNFRDFHRQTCFRENINRKKMNQDGLMTSLRHTSIQYPCE